MIYYRNIMKYNCNIFTIIFYHIPITSFVRITFWKQYEGVWFVAEFGVSDSLYSVGVDMDDTQRLLRLVFLVFVISELRTSEHEPPLLPVQ